MALTDAQKVKIRRYAGLPLNSSGGNDTLDNRLATLSAAAEAEVVSILDAIADIDAKLTELGTSTGGIIQVEEIRWDAGMSLSVTRSERARLIDELITLLGLTTTSGRGNGPTLRG